MLIDGFTFVAQIVNFAILIYLLHRFLYQPITRTMDRRKQAMADRWQEAEQQQQKAASEAQHYRQRQAELDRQQSRLMAQAGERAEIRRQHLLQQARQDIDRLRERWQESLRQEKRSFLERLRQTVSEQTYELVRLILQDVAHAQLEEQAIAAFCDRLWDLDPSARDELQRKLTESSAPILIRSGFDIPESQRASLLDTLRSQFEIRRELEIISAPSVEEIEENEDPDDRLPVYFVTSSQLICGISLLIGGREIAWSFQGDLQAVSERFEQLITAETERATLAEGHEARAERQHEQDLRQQLIRQTYNVTRRALQDLANADLEQQAIAVFLERLRQLEPAERQALQASNSAIAIRSSFEISPERQAQIIDRLREQQLVQGREIRFDTASHLICGIELQWDTRAIAWSLDDYLQSLETRLNAAVEVKQ